MLTLAPPYWLGCFAVTRYRLNWGVVRSTISSFAFLGGLSQIGLFSSNRDMKQLYKSLYEKYKDEVLSPKYRGLKLTSGKKVYQIDEREFTSSNFDDLKELVFKQKTK